MADEVSRRLLIFPLYAMIDFMWLVGLGWLLRRGRLWAIVGIALTVVFYGGHLLQALFSGWIGMARVVLFGAIALVVRWRFIRLPPAKSREELHRERPDTPLELTTCTRCKRCHTVASGRCPEDAIVTTLGQREQALFAVNPGLAIILTREGFTEHWGEQRLVLIPWNRLVAVEEWNQDHRGRGRGEFTLVVEDRKLRRRFWGRVRRKYAATSVEGYARLREKLAKVVGVTVKLTTTDVS